MSEIVKELEWSASDSWNIAKTVVGTYVVRPCLATNFTGQFLMGRPGKETSESDLYPSEEAAKAAAQSDFDARIRSAIERKAEPVAWVIPGDDNARADGFIDAMAWQEGEFTRPLYAALSASPSPVDRRDVEGSPLLEWAVDQWKAQVKHRPLVNVHRRSLDDVWRQVIRWAGGDPDKLVGPPHDELLAMESNR